MILPEPVVSEIRGPSGPDIAAVFGDVLALTYWDLWCLLVTRQQYQSNLNLLHDTLVDKRLNERFWSSHREDFIEDLIAHVADMVIRLQGLATVDDILSKIPERMLKKESQKSARHIIEGYGAYPPSEAMKRSPRRLLCQEAYRGMWPKLPVDPTPFAEKFGDLFLVKGKLGYIPKGRTFALANRIQKRIDRELLMSHLFVNAAAHRYAVYRAALTLYHEEHHFDDSYGSMGEMGQNWVKAILSETPALVDCGPHVFLKDLLMFLCWENYGLSDSDQTVAFIKNRLSSDERDVAIGILADTSARAMAGFQNYPAEEADRVIKKLDGGLAVADVRPVAGHLRLISPGSQPGQ